MSSVGPLASAPAASPARAAAEKAAADFEAVFAGEIAKLMMESVETGGEFSGGHGETMFRGVLAEQLGSELARGKGLGIAPAVLDQILKMQGEAR